jgi:hypothetical protein
MTKRPRLHITVRRGSTLATLILFVQAFHADLAAIVLGASTVAVAFRINQSTTSSLHEDIRSLMEELDDVQRVLDAKLARGTPQIQGRLRLRAAPQNEMGSTARHRHPSLTASLISQDF